VALKSPSKRPASFKLMTMQKVFQDSFFFFFFWKRKDDKNSISVDRISSSPPTFFAILVSSWVLLYTLAMPTLFSVISLLVLACGSAANARLVLGDSLGSLRYGMLGQFTFREEIRKFRRID